MQVAKAAREAGVVIDAIMIGPDMQRSLLAIAKSTGGYCFQVGRPQDESEGQAGRPVVAAPVVVLPLSIRS